MNAEISYDLVMDEDMSFVEGTYRLPGSDWQVFIFSRRDVDVAELKDSTWENAVTGVHVAFPRRSKLNQSVVQQLLGDYLGVDDWQVVHGPDSIQLR